MRLGPNRLAVGSVEGFNGAFRNTYTLVLYLANRQSDIYGFQKPQKVMKHRGYKTAGRGNILGMQDIAEHVTKRKVAAPGFTDTAIRDAEPTVLRLVNLWCDAIVENASDKTGWTEDRDMVKWCKCFLYRTNILWI